MKDDVVATVSHELRTPITSIRGFVELLLDASSDLTESQMRMLQTIERNAEHLQRVAEDLLADPGAGRGLRVAFTELDLSRLAEDAVHAMQTSATVAGIVLTIDARRRGTDLRRSDPPAPAPRQPPLQRDQILAPRRPGPRDRRQRGLLRQGAGARRRARHPRGRARPALRTLLPPGVLDRDGRAGDRPRPCHRQVRCRSARGLCRHPRHPRLVDHLQGVPPPARARSPPSSGPGSPPPPPGPGLAGGRRDGLTQRGTLPTGGPTGGRTHRRGRPKAARRACPARPRGRGRAPRSGPGGRWWPAGAPPPARSCPP